MGCERYLVQKQTKNRDGNSRGHHATREPSPSSGISFLMSKRSVYPGEFVCSFCIALGAFVRTPGIALPCLDLDLLLFEIKTSANTLRVIREDLVPS